MQWGMATFEFLKNLASKKCGGIDLEQNLIAAFFKVGQMSMPHCIDWVISPSGRCTWSWCTCRSLNSVGKNIMVSQKTTNCPMIMVQLLSVYGKLILLAMRKKWEGSAHSSSLNVRNTRFTPHNVVSTSTKNQGKSGGIFLIPITSQIVNFKMVGDVLGLRKRYQCGGEPLVPI